MSITLLNIGGAANDGNGQTLRSGGQVLNDNFAELDQRTSTAQATADAAVTDTELQYGLDAKVDKIPGKGLSTEDFTTGEKSKLAGLQPAHYRGTFITLAALEAGVATPVAGDYGDVDAGAGSDVQRYIWDATDTKWVLQGASGGGPAWGGIGGALANQADLQAALDEKVDVVAGMGLSERSFTQIEKTKLADVAVGATKNATDAELRDRATHTGKQLATTIADILGAVSQTMGVPTGALMEAGTNANGTYWRFANGLQICTRSITTLPANVAQGPIFVSPQVAGGSLPMPFAATPSMVPMGATNVGLGWVTMYTFPSTTSWGAWAMYSGQTSSVNGTIWLTAIGRWY